MASSRPKRKIEKVQRYGFDEESDDSSEDESFFLTLLMVRTPILSLVILKKLMTIRTLIRLPIYQLMTIGMSFSLEMITIYAISISRETLDGT